MLLAVDVGNTDTVFGLYQSGDWDYIWRTRSLVQENEIHYESKLRLHFLEAGLWFGDVETVVLMQCCTCIDPGNTKNAAFAFWR
jgi:type III pantothenate kinase